MPALNLPLPEPVAAYLTADMQGPDAVARCFTPHGVVKDRGQTHIGRKAIKAWKAASPTLYDCTIVPLAVELIDGVHVVDCHVAGSHINLTLICRLERGLIASLEITQ